MGRKKVLTAHEKKVELAKAAAPQYGIYIDGENIDKTSNTAASVAAELIGPLLLEIVNADCEEKTKMAAMGLIKNTVAKSNYFTISGTSIDLHK